MEIKNKYFLVCRLAERDSAKRDLCNACDACGAPESFEDRRADMVVPLESVDLEGAKKEAVVFLFEEQRRWYSPESLIDVFRDILVVPVEAFVNIEGDVRAREDELERKREEARLKWEAEAPQRREAAYQAEMNALAYQLLPKGSNGH